MTDQTIEDRNHPVPPAPKAPNHGETGPTVDEDQARQGQRILGMPTVLGTSTLIAAGVLGAVMIFFVF